MAKRLLPDSDVQRFYREEVVTADGSSITLNDLYSSYCNWSEGQDKDPLAMPTFMVFRDGEPLRSMVGARPKRRLLEELSDVL